MKRIIVAALIWAGLSLPAAAAIALTHKGTNSGTTTSVTVSGLTISNGDLIVVGGAARLAASGDTITISDSAGDTFTYYEGGTGNALRSFIAYVKTTGLSGGTVTVTTSGSAPLLLGISVEDVTGFDTTTPEDSTARATGNATNATPTITSGSPTYSGDLFYSSFQLGNVTYTEDATWTNTSGTFGNTNAKGSAGYFIAPGAGTATRTGSASGSANWRGIITGFKAAGGASPTFHGLSAIGAGK